MSLKVFLLIDGTLLLAFFCLSLFLKGFGGRFSLEQLFHDKQMPDVVPKGIPSLTKLIELESFARKNGSGIDYESLIGSWRFFSVWQEGKDKQNYIFSSLLRLFSAKLELIKDQSEKQSYNFYLTNSIQFGPLSIKFSGSGYLKGSQPLLPFYFKTIDLSLSERVLLSRSINQDDIKEGPFFAFIGIGENGQWLAARGRGGGLALWLKG